MTDNKCYLYGADYNPEQWRDYPDILEKDIELMQKGGFNAVSIGMFSWGILEPEEGKYSFDFFDALTERLQKADIKILLATPSAAMPIWFAKKYPEIRRVNADGVRVLPGRRAEHCISSPILREKLFEINKALSKRYSDRVYMWHVSNEYYGECHCKLCQNKFREYLKQKYNNDLDLLNKLWQTDFWSGSYGDWDEIESPSANGRFSCGGLILDWKRFTTHNTVDFMKNEIAALDGKIPVTTNFHGGLEHLDYNELAKHIDQTSWDMYPHWHMRNDFDISCETAFVYDYCRSLKKKPFLLMESAPSCPNHFEIPNKLKRPNFNILTSLHAVAHGADSVQYFQWRKSRGGYEKMHGAVVDHYGGSDTRVFSECERLGKILKDISETAGSGIKSEVAIIYDTETRWTSEYVAGYSHKDFKYKETCTEHYAYFYKNGINADVISSESDFSDYKIVIAPMLYMIKNEEKTAEYVRNGGNFVMTYISGVIDGYDCCHLGGFPAGKLKDVFGIRVEETDCILPDEDVDFEYKDKNYKAKDFCELVHTGSAESLAKFCSGIYDGLPAATDNRFGNGRAYYIAARSKGDFLDAFYADVCKNADVKGGFKLPDGVAASVRNDEKEEYVFLQNFTRERKTVALDKAYTDLVSGEKTISAELDCYETKVLSAAYVPKNI